MAQGYVVTPVFALGFVVCNSVQIMLGGFWLWLDVDETVLHGDFKANFFNYNMSNLCTEITL